MATTTSLDNGVRTWRGRYFETRDRLLASPRFQRLAAASPFTRPIARRRAQALFDLCAGFVYSQVLLACVRLDLFEILAAGPQSIDTLSVRLRLPRDAATRLLRAAVALELVAPRGADSLRPGRAWRHARRQSCGHGDDRASRDSSTPICEDPVALLRGERPETALARYWPYAGKSGPAPLGRRSEWPLTRA